MKVLSNETVSSRKTYKAKPKDLNKVKQALAQFENNSNNGNSLETVEKEKIPTKSSCCYNSDTIKQKLSENTSLVKKLLNNIAELEKLCQVRGEGKKRNTNLRHPENCTRPQNKFVLYLQANKEYLLTKYNIVQNKDLFKRASDEWKTVDESLKKSFQDEYFRNVDEFNQRIRDENQKLIKEFGKDATLYREIKIKEFNGQRTLAQSLPAL